MSEITLPAPELKQALAGLGKVVPRKSTLPVLQTIKLSRALDGKVTLTATDLDCFVTYNLEQPQPGQPIEVLLPFDQLSKAVRGSCSNVVVAPETKFKTRLRYQIAGSPLEQSVVGPAPEEFPGIPKILASASKMPAQFGEVLRQAFEMSSTDSSRHVLQGAYLDVEQPQCHSIISTNGRALFAANTFNFDLKQSVNIAKQKFLTWTGFLTAECELAIEPNKTAAGWVQIATERWNCITKQIDGQFPNWRQVVPKDTDGWTKIVLTEPGLAQLLDLSRQLPGNDNENRTLQLRVGQELVLEGRNKDDKDFTSATINGATVTGKPVTTALNREYLQTALKCGLNEIRINTALDPLLFCNQGKRMVVMPVRPTAPTTTQPKPQAQTEALPERKPDMPKETPKPEPTATTTQPSLIDQIDQVKESAKNLVRDLTLLTDAVKLAERERRTGEKEVETARAVLKKLQQVSL